MGQYSWAEAIEYVKEKLSTGEIKNMYDAYVIAVGMEGVHVVSKMPADVRKILNQAVKNGDLKHIKKEGLLPEIYCHKNGIGRAKEERKRIAFQKAECLKNVFVHAKDIKPE